MNNDKIAEAMDLVEDGEFESAIEILLALPPEPQYIEEVGNICFYRMDDPARALPYFDKAVRLMPKDARGDTYCRIALAHLALEDEASASRAFQSALESDPVHAATFLQLGKLHITQGKFQDAVELFETAIAHHVMQTSLSGGPSPGFMAQAALGRGIGYFQLDDTEKGMGAAQQLADIGDEEGLEMLADALDESEKPKWAKKVRALL